MEYSSRYFKAEGIKVLIDYEEMKIYYYLLRNHFENIIISRLIKGENVGKDHEKFKFFKVKSQELRKEIIITNKLTETLKESIKQN